MTKRYYQETVFKDSDPEVRVCDSKRSHTEFAIYCDNESHADALVKALNRRGYEISEFHACTIANDLQVTA
jgi:hypothetical protein